LKKKKVGGQEPARTEKHDGNWVAWGRTHRGGGHKNKRRIGGPKKTQNLGKQPRRCVEKRWAKR